jgi:hypothetical protein
VPKDAASGIAPIPQLSSTIQITRRNIQFERNMGTDPPRLQRT